VPFPNRLLAASTKRRDNQGVRTADHHLGCVPCVRPCPKAHRRQRARTSAKNRTYSAADPRVGIDGNGNLLSDGTTTYTWDARDRLVAVSGPGGSTTYGYDSRNLRVRVGEQKILLSGKEEVAEYGVTPVRYDRDPQGTDNLPAERGDETLFVLRDAHKSVYRLLDSQGAVRAAYSYDVFGERTTTSGDAQQAWGWVGRRY
jgi:YD repeat-containing protein